jgi:hypothetical protein
MKRYEMVDQSTRFKIALDHVDVDRVPEHCIGGDLSNRDPI